MTSGKVYLILAFDVPTRSAVSVGSGVGLPGLDRTIALSCSFKMQSQRFLQTYDFEVGGRHSSTPTPHIKEYLSMEQGSLPLPRSNAGTLLLPIFREVAPICGLSGK